MKKLFLLILITFPLFCFSQGQNISLTKKSIEPYVAPGGDTLRVTQQIKITTGSNPDGSFKYVQLLNNFNEPIKPADSRFAMRKQEIKFFKTQDGATYAFTKFFSINIDAALQQKEVEVK